MKNLPHLITLIALMTSCKENKGVEYPQGKNLLLIGNSFFRPYAEKLNAIALATDFENHNSTIIFRGGSNGRAINFWRDSTTSEHKAIKAALDQGNIDIFGMTSGHDTNDYTEVFSAWIAYALQNNPDLTVFISISTIDYPDYWDTTALQYGFNTIEELYDHYVTDRIHENIVDHYDWSFRILQFLRFQQAGQRSNYMKCGKTHYSWTTSTEWAHFQPPFLLIQRATKAIL